jgi:hypothetical protein
MGDSKTCPACNGVVFVILVDEAMLLRPEFMLSQRDSGFKGDG